MADQVTTLLQIVQQETGNNNNNWGNILNQQLGKLESAITGQSIITVTGGTKALSDDEQRPQILLITGNLLSDSFIEVKPRLKNWIILNATTGEYGVYLRTPSNPSYQIGRGQSEHMWCDGVTIWPVGDQGRVPIGGLVWSFRTVGAADGGDPSYRECNGQTLSRLLYDRLFDRIGGSYGNGDNLTTFHLPNLTDTGRYVRSRGGNAGQTVSTKQDDLVKSHTHTASASSDGNHYHPGSSTSTNGSHNHDYNAVTGNDNAVGLVSGNQNARSVSSKTSMEGAHSHTVNNAWDGIHTHTITVVADGGVETRPTSIVCFALIRVQ